MRGCYYPTTRSVEWGRGEGVRGVQFVLCEFIPWGGEAGFYMQIIPG